MCGCLVRSRPRTPYTPYAPHQESKNIKTERGSSEDAARLPTIPAASSHSQRPSRLPVVANLPAQRVPEQAGRDFPPRTVKSDSASFQKECIGSERQEVQATVTCSAAGGRNPTRVKAKGAPTPRPQSHRAARTPRARRLRWPLSS